MLGVMKRRPLLLQVRVSAWERTLFREAADREHITVSELVRLLVRQRAATLRRERQPTEAR